MVKPAWPVLVSCGLLAACGGSDGSAPSDLMTFLNDCGEKSFVDLDVACGEFEPRSCSCGSETQNSHQQLAALAGRACP